MDTPRAYFPIILAAVRDSGITESEPARIATFASMIELRSILGRVRWAEDHGFGLDVHSRAVFAWWAHDECPWPGTRLPGIAKHPYGGAHLRCLEHCGDRRLWSYFTDATSTAEAYNALKPAGEFESTGFPGMRVRLK